MDEHTEKVTATRTVWTGVLELARQTDMSMLERIVSVSAVAADYETKPFLALRLKLITAVQNCYEEESLKKLDGGEEKEASDDIELTIAEATYIDVLMPVTAFKHALTLKQDLWRAISNLYNKYRKEREAL